MNGLSVVLNTSNGGSDTTRGVERHRGGGLVFDVTVILDSIVLTCKPYNRAGGDQMSLLTTYMVASKLT